MSKHSRSIFTLAPSNVTVNVWGGRWIPHWKGLAARKRPVGESWEVSTHASHPSRARNLQGKTVTLDRLLAHPIPFLVKIIDARSDLSVQVHPDNRYARRVEQQYGKSETWLILETGKRRDDGYIYLGFRPRRNLRRAFEEALDRGQAKDVLPFLNKIRVRAGEVYHLPPGTIHAAGRGVRLYEIQQSSDITYRVWDWNRRVRRPLHRKKAFDVLSFSPKTAEAFRRRVPIVMKRSSVVEECLVKERRGRYAAHRLHFSRKNARIDQPGHRGFVALTITEGDVKVTPTKERSVRLRAGRTAVILGGIGFDVQSLSDRATVIKSFCP